MEQTHCEFFDFKNGAKVIVCGIPDECDHDSDGDFLLFNDDGEYFRESDIPGYSEHSNESLEFMKKHHINGGCSSCSKCGKPFQIDINII